MNEFYRAKFNELFMEFTRYLITHPDFGADIPMGAEVVLLDRLDPGYTNYMLEKAPKEGAVFINVGKLAPTPGCPFLLSSNSPVPMDIP